MEEEKIAKTRLVGIGCFAASVLTLGGLFFITRFFMDASVLWEWYWVAIAVAMILAQGVLLKLKRPEFIKFIHILLLIGVIGMSVTAYIRKTKVYFFIVPEKTPNISSSKP